MIIKYKGFTIQCTQEEYDELYPRPNNSGLKPYTIDDLKNSPNIYEAKKKYHAWLKKERLQDKRNAIRFRQKKLRAKGLVKKQKLFIVKRICHIDDEQFLVLQQGIRQDGEVSEFLYMKYN